MAARSGGPSEYPFLFRLLHWVLAASFGILFLTGLSLHAAARPSWSVFSGAVPAWLWRGRVYVWHYWAAVAFFPAVIASLAYVRHERFWLRPTHIILTGGGVVVAVTGVWMMFPFGGRGPIKAAVAIHAAGGIVVLGGTFLWHVIGGLTRYLRWLVDSFHPFRAPAWAPVAAFVPLAVLTTWVLFEGWPLRVPWRDLVAKRIPRNSSDAGLAGLPWDRAPPLAVRLVNGSGFYSGQSRLTLQALHDGTELFVKARWEDPVADRQYWPWKRTPEGWELLQTSSRDETVYYEDKFSIVFPIRPSWQFEQVGCAASCHVDGAYGWGYKGSRPDIDVWHWKAVRTDPVGRADDKYWSEPDFENEDIGRFGDPHEQGGYTKNLSEGSSHPVWLPDDLAAVRRGAIPEEHAVPYQTKLAAGIEPGTLIPGIVAAAFSGDRGDVRCVSEHRQGFWTLYLCRKLDTGSSFDVRLVPGGVYPFGCAAFDHAAKRHAYSLPVFHLVLEP